MRKLTFFPVLLVLCSILFTNCKKDEDSSYPNYLPRFEGGWKYISGQSNEKFVLFNSDFTFSILSSDNYGIREMEEGVPFINDRQIVMEYTIYNYSIIGDTLKITSPDREFILVKDETAPEKSDWIKSITKTIEYKAPIANNSDIAYDGTRLWYGNAYESGYLYKIDPTTGKKDSIPVNQYAWAVEYDGVDLWVSSNGYDQIIRINKTTGADLGSSVEMGAWIYGIAKDGDYLWCYSNNEHTLYKYNYVTNTIAKTYITSSGYNGLAFANSYLYIAANGYLHKCKTNPLSTVASYRLSDFEIHGVAYDGSSFWVSGIYYVKGDYQYKLIKVNGVD